MRYLTIALADIARSGECEAALPSRQPDAKLVGE
jgi:hypothetical protein